MKFEGKQYEKKYDILYLHFMIYHIDCIKRSNKKTKTKTTECLTDLSKKQNDYYVYIFLRRLNTSCNLISIQFLFTVHNFYHKGSQTLRLELCIEEFFCLLKKIKNSCMNFRFNWRCP